jgi:hypothetical protein
MIVRRRCFRVLLQRALVYVSRMNTKVMDDAMNVRRFFAGLCISSAGGEPSAGCTWAPCRILSPPSEVMLGVTKEGAITPTF